MLIVSLTREIEILYRSAIRAGVVELADTQVLEACAARRAGSSPAPGIK